MCVCVAKKPSHTRFLPPCMFPSPHSFRLARISLSVETRTAITNSYAGQTYNDVASISSDLAFFFN